MRQHHQRNSGNCRRRDQRKKDKAQYGHDTAIDVLSHNAFIGSRPQDWVLRERHHNHAKNDRDVHEGKRPNAGDSNDECKAQHPQPANSENRYIFGAAILAHATL